MPMNTSHKQNENGISVTKYTGFHIFLELHATFNKINLKQKSTCHYRNKETHSYTILANVLFLNIQICLIVG